MENYSFNLSIAITSFHQGLGPKDEMLIRFPRKLCGLGKHAYAVKSAQEEAARYTHATLNVESMRP